MRHLASRIWHTIVRAIEDPATWAGVLAAYGVPYYLDPTAIPVVPDSDPAPVPERYPWQPVDDFADCFDSLGRVSPDWRDAIARYDAGVADGTIKPWDVSPTDDTWLRNYPHLF